MIQVVVPNWVDRTRGKPALLAFAAGLDYLGLKHKIVSLEKARPGPHPMVCWGVFKEKLPARLPFKKLQEIQTLVGELIIIERGFVGREDHYVVNFNDLNARGHWPHDWSVPSDRWDALGVELKPWGVGDEILLIGQVPWDTSCQHVNHNAWLKRMATRLSHRYADCPVVFRPHPLQRGAIDASKLSVDRLDHDRTLEEALDKARFVVTFSSTVGVDALVAGRLAVSFDPTSMIYGWNQNLLDWDHEGALPRRQEWAHWLAYCQWTFEEMRLGLPWLHLHREW